MRNNGYIERVCINKNMINIYGRFLYRNVEKLI